MGVVVGYKGIGENEGIYVDAENAAFYAMQCCRITAEKGEVPEAEFLKMLTDWFFSGSFIEVEDGEDKQF